MSLVKIMELFDEPEIQPLELDDYCTCLCHGKNKFGEKVGKTSAAVGQILIFEKKLTPKNILMKPFHAVFNSG